MARLLPFRRSDRPMEPRRPRLVELDDDSAEAVFAALSARTARDILGRLYDEPGTATDVAEAADTSLQNARYHLEKLRSAGLVEAVDTWYSSRGTEMTVYAPTSEPLVVAAGPDEQTSALRSALGRLVGALGVLGIASLVVDRLARFGVAGLVPVGRPRGADSGDGALTAADATATEFEAATETVNATGTPSPVPEPTQTVTAMPVQPEDAGLVDFGAGLPPGALFFLGGLVVIAAVAAWWYWRRYRPLYGSAG